MGHTPGTHQGLETETPKWDEDLIHVISHTRVFSRHEMSERLPAGWFGCRLTVTSLLVTFLEVRFQRNLL